MAPTVGARSRQLEVVRLEGAEAAAWLLGGIPPHTIMAVRLFRATSRPGTQHLSLQHKPRCALLATCPGKASLLSHQPANLYTNRRPSHLIDWTATGCNQLFSLVRGKQSDRSLFLDQSSVRKMIGIETPPPGGGLERSNREIFTSGTAMQWRQQHRRLLLLVAHIPQSSIFLVVLPRRHLCQLRSGQTRTAWPPRIPRWSPNLSPSVTWATRAL